MSTDVVTEPGTPLAKIVRLALREGLEETRKELIDMIDEKLNALEGTLCEALVNSVSPRFLEVEQRLEALERDMEHLKRRLTPTEPAPAP